MSDPGAVSPREGPLLDAERVNLLRRDPAGWAEVVALYRSYASELVSALESALAARQQQGVVRVVHQLKGCSANLGLLAIVALCERVEQAAQEGGLSTMGDAAPTLRRLIELSLGHLT